MRSGTSSRSASQLSPSRLDVPADDRRGMATNENSDSGSPRRRAAPLPIRGRADVIAKIDALLARTRDGLGSVLLIEGPPGIGKSRVVDEVALRAARMGMRPLVGGAYEDQQTVPFAPLLGALLHS